MSWARMGVRPRERLRLPASRSSRLPLAAGARPDRPSRRRSPPRRRSRRSGRLPLRHQRRHRSKAQPPRITRHGDERRRSSALCSDRSPPTSAGTRRLRSKPRYIPRWWHRCATSSAHSTRCISRRRSPLMQPRMPTRSSASCPFWRRFSHYRFRTRHEAPSTLSSRARSQPRAPQTTYSEVTYTWVEAKTIRPADCARSMPT